MIFILGLHRTRRIGVFCLYSRQRIEFADVASSRVVGFHRPVPIIPFQDRPVIVFPAAPTPSAARPWRLGPHALSARKSGQLTVRWRRVGSAAQLPVSPTSAAVPANRPR